MDRPVFTSIQPPGVAHADADSAGETPDVVCALADPVAATTRNADKTAADNPTALLRDVGFGAVAETLAARRYEAVGSFIFSPALQQQ